MHEASMKIINQFAISEDRYKKLEDSTTLIFSFVDKIYTALVV